MSFHPDYFNSHAHVERDWKPISHATDLNTFQLTRSRGAWLIGICFFKITLYFNSHAHVERDCTLWWICSGTPYFNSHAHVERDCIFLSLMYRYIKFQLTRSRGAWLTPKFGFGQITLFQLTRSRGAWPCPAEYSLSFVNFNSHAHVERDVADDKRDTFAIAFQLTRSRGAWHTA